MHKVEPELKQHQLNTVKQALFVESMRKKLLALPEQLSTELISIFLLISYRQLNHNSQKSDMAYDYSDLVEKTKRWAEQAFASGWINEEAAQQLGDFDARTPDALFNHSESRPLIVAFMGGTGVGKSSLLNRLAGKAIARVGIERPTSREVTLFHHQTVAIQHLPDTIAPRSNQNCST